MGEFKLDIFEETFMFEYGKKKSEREMKTALNKRCGRMKWTKSNEDGKAMSEKYYASKKSVFERNRIKTYEKITRRQR